MLDDLMSIYFCFSGNRFFSTPLGILFEQCNKNRHISKLVKTPCCFGLICCSRCNFIGAFIGCLNFVQSSALVTSRDRSNRVLSLSAYYQRLCPSSLFFSAKRNAKFMSVKHVRLSRTKTNCSNGNLDWWFLLRNERLCVTHSLSQNQ